MNKIKNCLIILFIISFTLSAFGCVDNSENKENESNEENELNIIIEDTRLEVNIGTEITYVTLYDNPTTRSLLNLLPMQITMTDLSRQEYYYPLPNRLPLEGDLEYYYEEGDFTYWSGGWFVIYYQDNNNNNNIRSGFRSMGKIDDNGIEAFKNLNGQSIIITISILD